jgi:hypothetical protein
MASWTGHEFVRCCAVTPEGAQCRHHGTRWVSTIEDHMCHMHEKQVHKRYASVEPVEGPEGRRLYRIVRHKPPRPRRVLVPGTDPIPELMGVTVPEPPPLEAEAIYLVLIADTPDSNWRPLVGDKRRVMRFRSVDQARRRAERWLFRFGQGHGSAVVWNEREQRLVYKVGPTQ